MAKSHFFGKRRRTDSGLAGIEFRFQSAPRFVEITNFFKEAPEYRPVLFLFRKRTLVPKGEIEQVCRGALTVLTAKGVLTGEKGGRLFKLTNAAKVALGQMQK